MSSQGKRKERRGQGRPSTSVSVGKDALIAAVRKALKTTPPGELTINQVAELAGVDQRLIRYYFGQLPDLLKAVSIEITQELRARFVAANFHSGSLRERLRLRVSIFLDMFGDNPHYHRLLVDFLFKSDTATREAAFNTLRQSIDELDKLLQEGKKTGEGEPLDARFVHISSAALCEFLFSAKPVFAGLFGSEAGKPEFRERYCDFITDLMMRSASRRK